MYFPRWKVVLILAIIAAGFVAAVPNLLPRERADALPEWLQPVTLGLDLQGGSHLLLEVEVEAVVEEQLDNLLEAVRDALRGERIRYAGLAVEDGAVIVEILDSADRDRAQQAIADASPDTTIGRSGERLIVRFEESALERRRESAVLQSVEIVRRRIDELGTREPTIQRQGEDRILVQLPGVRDPERVKDILGKTAKLTFHLVDPGADPNEALRGRVPPGTRLLPGVERGPDGEPLQYYVVRRRVEVGGESLVDAQPGFGPGQRPLVTFRFDSVGGKRFGNTTRDNVGRQLAIVLDDAVISAPVIQEPILGGSGQITGRFSVQETQDLSLLLRAGALPAPLTVLEERTVGPDLGADSIRAGQFASALGLVLVAVFMILAYGRFGAFANVALFTNLVLLLGLLSALGATLTLPGIAGIVLTVGMAVDANVLIFERMREESRLGRSLVNAVQTGFSRAFGTILDANLTTLIAALLLFFFGSGPVRGFAVTLSIGLVTSMFTAIMLTRLLVVTWVRRAKPKALPI